MTARPGRSGAGIDAFRLETFDSSGSLERDTALGGLRKFSLVRRASVVLWGIRSFYRIVPLPPGTSRTWRQQALDEVAPALFATPWTRDAHLHLSRQRVHDASGAPRDIVIVAAASRPDIESGVGPLLRAGFSIEGVTTPALALAALARLHAPLAAGSGASRGPGDHATAYLAVGCGGGALVIVRGTTLLFARDLSWRYREAAHSSRERLLERYVFATKLGPELTDAFETVRRTYGIGVERMLTCGDVPELRSWTIPLIEELDLEVDTLDSLAGLDEHALPPNSEFRDQAAAFRLAWTVAVSPPINMRPRRFRDSIRRLSWLRRADLQSRAAL